MFRFTLRGFILYIAFAGSMLALTRVHWFPLGNAALALAGLLARPLIPPRTLVFALFGVMAGSQAGDLLLDRHIHQRFANPPSQFLKDEWYEYKVHNRPFAHELGALLGATLGILLERRRAAK